MTEKERISTADIARKDSHPEQYVATGTSGGGGAARAPEARGEPAREEKHTALFLDRESNDLRSRWDSIQTGFVDEPRAAVKKADELVATAMKRLAEIFADERKKLESQWDRGDNASTEDLRLALQRYRSFFGRLLSI